MDYKFIAIFSDQYCNDFIELLGGVSSLVWKSSPTDMNDAYYIGTRNIMN